ncbi:MAG: class IV adenylate cyclase [Halobacteriales archaeon]
MYEVEIKLELPGGLEPIRDRLAQQGAQDRGTVIQRDTYYEAPHRSFPETDEALRLRRERTAGETTAQLTYKGPLVEAESKTRRELETGVDDGATVADILEALGFEPAAEVEKHRDRYVLGEYHITLDDVTDVGTFIEIESSDPVPEAEIESVREGARERLRELGLDPTEQIRTSYLELLLTEE